jgi:ABC-type multidrug transport system ATPase subunit
MSDEPSTGLDPLIRQQLWEILKEIKKNRSVLLTSHMLDEIDELCDRICVLIGGKMVGLGTAQQLKSKWGGGYRLTLRFIFSFLSFVHFLKRLKSSEDEKDEKSVVAQLEEHAEGIKLVQKLGSVATFELPPGASLARLFEILEAKHFQEHIVEYSVSQPTLDQAFVRIVEQEEEAAEARKKMKTEQV